MPAFDGDPIKVGDSLFEYNEGIVTVLQLYSNKILVAVPGKGTRTYSYAGVLSGAHRKTLYWHDPDVVIPRKDGHAWNMQREMLRDTMAIQSRFITSAHFRYPNEPDDVHGVLTDASAHIDQEFLDSASLPASQ